MWIFIRAVPADTTRKDLKRFLCRGVRAWAPLPLLIGSKLRRYSIMRITDGETGNVEYHGLAEVEPLETAKNAVIRLNGRKLRGREVEVRRYHRRSHHRERRIFYTDVSAQGIEERRWKERRRGSLRTVATKAPKAEGISDFLRLNR